MLFRSPVLLPGKSHRRRSLVGCSPWGHKKSGTTERLHFHFSLSSLEKEMATHSSILAWRIPRTEEPGGLPSRGSHRVRHDKRLSSSSSSSSSSSRGLFYKGINSINESTTLMTKSPPKDPPLPNTSTSGKPFQQINVGENEHSM